MQIFFIVINCSALRASLVVVDWIIVGTCAAAFVCAAARLCFIIELELLKPIRRFGMDTVHTNASELLLEVEVMEWDVGDGFC